MLPKGSKLVLVTWEDAYAEDYGWIDIDELDKKPKSVVCYSVGWLIGESEKNMRIVPHITDVESKEKDFSVQGALVIPKGMITNVEILNYGRKKKKNTN